MKDFLFTITLLFLGVIVILDQHIKPPSVSKVVERNIDSVVSIRDDKEAKSGSGFVIMRRGKPYVMTNAHVINGVGKNIVVRFHDGKRYAGIIIKTDERRDIALLKVLREDLKPVNLRMAKPYQGDTVIAMGEPFGFTDTVTVGVLSHLGRVMTEDGIPWYQTDAPINHGNSGGPSFDAFGDLIGMNVALWSQNDMSGNVGLGFMIPVKEIVDFLNE